MDIINITKVYVLQSSVNYRIHYLKLSVLSPSKSFYDHH